MWASIAMNVRATDSFSDTSSIDSGSSYSTSSSISSYSSSGPSDSDSAASWSSFSSSSTTNSLADPLSPFPTPTHQQKKRILVDYSKMPNSSSRSLRRLSSNNQDKRQSFHAASQADSDRSITLHGRHPYSPRRTVEPGGKALTTSSSHCLSRFLQKESRHGSTSLPGLFSSSAAVMPSLVRNTSRSSRPGLRSMGFNRRRTLERKVRVRLLHQALRWDATVPPVAPFKNLRRGDDGDYETASEASSIVTSKTDRHEETSESRVTFSYKKTAGLPSTTMPPGLSRNISSTSSTLHGILKESRRETLLDLLEDPKQLLRLNTSSLVPDFRPIAIASKDPEESPGHEIDTPPSFHDGIRDLSSQDDTTASFKSTTVLMPSTSIGSIPSTTTVVEPAFYHRLPAPIPRRPAYGAHKSRSMKDVRRAMQDLAVSKPAVGGNNFRMLQQQQRQRRQDMKRSASAPKNSFVRRASSSVISRSSRAAGSSAMSRESSEIAALQALAGKKHPILRRPSLATTLDSGAGTVGTNGGGGGIPTTITIVKSTSSFEDSCPSLPKRSLETPPLPDDDTSATEEDTFAASPETPSPSERERTIRHRMSSLVKLTSSRRRDSFLTDAQNSGDSLSLSLQQNNRRGSDTSDSASKRRHFQRASSSRKSFSLMIQHANLQQQQQQGGSSKDALMGDISMKSTTRQRRRSSICSNSTNGLDESTANLSTSGRRGRTAASNSKAAPSMMIPTLEKRTTTDSKKVAPDRRIFLKRQASAVSRRRILALRNSS